MAQKSKNKHYSLRSFFSYMAQFKLRFGTVFFSFIVADILLAIIPVFVGKLVGVLATAPVDEHQAFIYVWTLIACSTGHDIVWRASEFLYMKLLNPLAYRYENIVFRHVINMPYPYFVDKFTGKIASYINLLGQELRYFMENIYWNYTNEVVRLVVIAAVLTAVNWQTGAIFIGGILLMLLVGRYTIRNSAKFEKVEADVQSTKNGKIVDAIANFVNVKSFRKELDELKTIKVEQEKTINAANRSFFWNLVFWASMSVFVRNLIWPATILINVFLFLDNRLSIAELTTFLTALLLFSDFIWGLVWNISQFNLKLARMEEAYKHLFGKTNIMRSYLEDKARRKVARPLNDSLDLNRLNFAYPDKEDVDVLSDINLTIKRGEKIGIVGRSGSGKTTMTKLLLGYYPVESGQITLDGSAIDTRDLSQLISYVPQDTPLFHRSIADNIAYATDKDVTRVEIVKAAKQAHAEEFIAQIASGYDALVGERGVKLSAGQRQRIAIARAFLDDKPILVLDEATSALDSESEVLVQDALEKLWQNKTVIAIAHRLSTLRNMDRVIVMDKGKIVEQGSHEELLDHKGIYANLWAHQSGGFLED